MNEKNNVMRPTRLITVAALILTKIVILKM